MVRKAKKSTKARKSPKRKVARKSTKRVTKAHKPAKRKAHKKAAKKGGHVPLAILKRRLAKLAAIVKKRS